MIDPVFLAEAAINGLLLGGVLALLALGLNLIFGVIDIVWIASPWPRSRWAPCWGSVCTC